MGYSNKQYPSLREVTGLIMGLRQQELNRQDLKRQKKRDRALSGNMAEVLKLDKRKFELDKVRQQAIANHYERTNALAMLKFKQDKEKEGFDVAMNLADLAQKLETSAFERLEPGGIEDDESLLRRMALYRMAGTSAGLEPEAITRNQMFMKHAQKPEEELSKDEKLRVLMQSGLISKAPEAFIPVLKEEFGIDMTPEMFKTDEMEPEQRSMLSKMADLLIDRRIEAADFSKAVERITAGEFDKVLEGIDIKPEPLKPMSGMELSAMLSFARTDEERTEILAESKSRSLRREYHAVENTKYFNEWEVVDYQEAKNLRDQGLISQEHLQKFSEYWDEKTGKKTPVGSRKTSGGFEF